MKWQYGLVSVMVMVQSFAMATPVDRQVDAARARVAPNKLAVLGGPKAPLKKTTIVGAKVHNQSVNKVNKPVAKGGHG